MTSTAARFQYEQPDLEVVPPETGLYSLPTPPLVAATHEFSSKEQLSVIGSDGNQPTLPQIESQTTKASKRTILGLSVPLFWAVVVLFVILIAGGIGGGVGGGLSAQRKSESQSNTSRFEIPLPSHFTPNALTMVFPAVLIAIPAAATVPRHVPLTQPHPLPHRRHLHLRRRILSSPQMTVQAWTA